MISASRRREEARERARRRVRRERMIAAAATAAVVLLAGAVFELSRGGSSSESSASAAPKPPAPPQLPRGGRTLLPTYRIVAYYGAPGHLPLIFAGTEIVEFSPTAELNRTMEVVGRNLAGAQS